MNQELLERRVDMGRACYVCSQYLNLDAVQRIIERQCKKENPS